ncbi:MAG: RNA polymerase sigma factor [Bacteroidales bacterium]|jgi:RNA polymerase sigma-70 factor (ECF subfamily)|nr:RNA polymerase sigma factor [Bacteroidales bacterium]MDD4702694.1 RNA polymerase sigma factor [Bacteroidales bacterium]
MDLEEIIEGCKKDKPKAQKALYDMFSEKLFGLSLRYCKNRADAQDVFQEAFVKVFKNIKNYESFGSFEAWMKRIFVNHAINFYRYNKANLHISTSDVDIPYEDEDNDEYIDNYTNTEILKAIQKLPNQQRVVFNLIEVEGQTYEETAKMLDVKEGTLRSQNSKAKNHLREYLMNIENIENYK